MSAKKRKACDPVIHLESFEGLTADEVKEKMLSLHSMMNLGVEQMHELLKSQEDELRESKEAYLDLKKLSDHKDGHYKKMGEAHAKEVKELMAKAEEERKLVVEEAKNSAATSVYEAMYEMAKEAAAAGFSLPHWDLQGWGQILGKDEDLPQADSREAEAAVGADGDGAAADATTGDEGKDAQA